MKVSAKGRYALIMMADIASLSTAKSVSLKDIANRREISLKYAEQIASALTKKSLLTSARGPQGGYTLVKSAEDYSVMEIIKAVDGDFAIVPNLAEHAKREENDLTHSFWENISSDIAKKLTNTSLLDVVRLGCVN